MTSLIGGEASTGYGQRKYEDPRLSNLNGALVDASLIYTPTPLTKVTLRNTTAFEETSVANASGAVVRRVTLEISHALLRNVTLTALGTFQDTQYRGVTLEEKYFNGTLRVQSDAHRRDTRQLHIREAEEHIGRQRLHRERVPARIAVPALELGAVLPNARLQAIDHAIHFLVVFLAPSGEAQ
jgi:hypothetical protein